MLRRSKGELRAILRALLCMLVMASSVAFAYGQHIIQQQQPATGAQTTSSTVQSPLSTREFSRAQTEAQKILAGSEFQREPPTLWDIVKERLGEALVRLFVGIDRVTSAAPWMGRALEWALFLAAAVGLVVWVLRAVQRQRLRVALGDAHIKTAERTRERDDWQKLAEAEAAKGAWREAIHALYWAAIIHLESRRAWRHNPARTPREYVRLLKPNSVEERELRGLTRMLEKSWYGQQVARKEEYDAARQGFERLAGADSAAANTGQARLAGGGA